MMSNDRLNNKNTDNTLGSRIDSETRDRENADNAINNKISDMQANGDQWRDTDANRTITKPVGNVRVNLKLGVTNHDLYLFSLENLSP